MPFASTWISPARNFEFFGWDSKPRYLREHTAIAMGLVAALLIGIVGLSRHQNFSTKFSKRWRTQHSHHTTLDDGEGADSDDHSFARRVSWEYRNIPKPSIFPQKRREFVCLKLEIIMRNPAAFTNRQVSYQGEDTIPVGIPRCSEPDPPGPARSLWKTLWAEVGENVTIFRPIRTTNRICITTRWILSAIHSAKWHYTNQKKLMRVQGVF